MWVGCLCRDMHERYGKWNLVYVRFRRWPELGLTDDWQHMIDSIIVRGHSQAAGAKGYLQGRLWSKPRGLYEQNPRRCDGQGRPPGFVLTGGEVF